MRSSIKFAVATALAVATVSCTFASVKSGDVIYRCAFSEPGADAGWQGLDNPAVSWSTTPAGQKALHIANPVDGAHNAAVTRSFDVTKLRGLHLIVSARVKAKDVVKPEHSYNGIKVMLVVKSPSGDRYNQLPDVYGTFDWKDIQFNSEVPADTTSVDLMLGIENTSGAADFDDIKVTVSGAPPDAVAKPISAPVKAGDPIYHWTFSDPGADAGWQGMDNPAIGWKATPPSMKALRIVNAVGGALNAAAYIPLDVAKVRGHRLVVSANVKATDVVKPPQPWNGVKVMLVVKSPKGDQYDQLPDVHGTFDWRDIRFNSDVPANATSVTLVLAIENTSGTADFDNVKITAADTP